MNKIITREQIQAKLNDHEPISIIEALPQKYFDDKHLPTAINIPLAELETKAPELIPDKKTTTIVYCSNTECDNSRIAAEMLYEMGYVNTFEYVEGKQHWVAGNLPTEST